MTKLNNVGMLEGFMDSNFVHKLFKKIITLILVLFDFRFDLSITLVAISFSEPFF